MDQEELHRRFTYHAPHGDQTGRYVEIRSGALAYAEMLLRLTPESREQSLAITALEDAVFWSNAAIARREGSAE